MTPVGHTHNTAAHTEKGLIMSDEVQSEPARLAEARFVIKQQVCRPRRAHRSIPWPLHIRGDKAMLTAHSRLFL